MNEHHDPELCKRLAVNVMGWELLHEGAWAEDPMWRNENGSIHLRISNWDPCCNPTHSWMLEKKLVADGWMIMVEENRWVYLYLMEGDRVIQRIKQTIGINRLHAMALAVDVIEVTDD